MGKAIVKSKVGDEGLYLISYEFETRVKDIKSIDNLVLKLMDEMEMLQQQIEETNTEDPETDPAPEEDPTPDSDPEPEQDPEPIPEPDPDPDPEPEPEDERSMGGSVRGMS